MKDLLLSVGGDDKSQAIRRFLAGLLETGVVEAVLAPASASPGAVTHVLATDPGLLGKIAEPLAPVMSVSGARVTSDALRRGAQGKVAALLRPCEMRALVELVKLKQASAESIVAVGIDCLGTCDPVAYREAGGVAEGLPTRDACRVCLNPAPPEGALPGITLGFIGLDPSDGVLVSVSDALGADMAAAIAELASGDGAAAKDRRARALRDVLQDREAAYEAYVRSPESRAALSGIEAFSQELAGCTGCHNCRVACPVCYCRECIFDTETFEHETRQLLRRSGRKGGLKMPSETVLYHLTRMNHMSLSCVGCGLCEASCPAHLRLFRLFAMASRRTQEVFGYVPGRGPDEELPFATFREEELEPR